MTTQIVTTNAVVVSDAVGKDEESDGGVERNDDASRYLPSPVEKDEEEVTKKRAWSETIRSRGSSPPARLRRLETGGVPSWTGETSRYHIVHSASRTISARSGRALSDEELDEMVYLFENGEKRMRDNDFEDARRSFYDVARAYPGCALAYWKCALALVASKKTIVSGSDDEAMCTGLLRWAVALEPSNEPLRRNAELLLRLIADSTSPETTPSLLRSPKSTGDLCALLTVATSTASFQSEHRKELRRLLRTRRLRRLL